MTERSTPALQSLTALRIVVALLLAAHGWMRAVGGTQFWEHTRGFGGWLDSQGIPFGFYVASAITLFEILGTPLLALGRWVVPLVAVYTVIYATGIVMVHWPAGWFVVGVGRNGMEYSVLLIACLWAVAWPHVRKR